jgi:hypothetical protein
MVEEEEEKRPRKRGLVAAIQSTTERATWIKRYSLAVLSGCVGSPSVLARWRPPGLEHLEVHGDSVSNEVETSLG